MPRSAWLQRIQHRRRCRPRSSAAHTNSFDVIEQAPTRAVSRSSRGHRPYAWRTSSVQGCASRSPSHLDPVRSMSLPTPAPILARDFEHRDRVLDGPLRTSSTVESNARRWLRRPTICPIAVITERTASKIRGGRSEHWRSLAAPQHQHWSSGTRPTSVNAGTAICCFPANVRFELPDRSLDPTGRIQRLEHHHRRDHISRHPTDGPAST